jgi:hypothetical protein
MTTTLKTCAGTRKDGAPCGAYIDLNPATGLCINHDTDPARREAQRQRQSNGGHASSLRARAERRARLIGEHAEVAEKPHVLETIDGLVKIEAANIARTFNGTTDARTSMAVTAAIKEQRANLALRDVAATQRRIERTQRKIEAGQRKPLRAV